MNADTVRKSASLEQRILLSLAMRGDAPKVGATASYTIDNCLNFARKSFDEFDRLVEGKTVLDYGCGPGWQAVAMRARCRAERVVGLDIKDDWLEHGTRLADAHHCGDRVTFVTSVPPEMAGRFDVVVSLSAFEHFADPARELQRMSQQLRPGGRLALAFAEPWYSNNGSHVGNYTRIPGTGRPVPWLNLVFSDEALLTLRAQFRADHPTRLEDIEGGLNKMTIRRFEGILRASGLRIDNLQYAATWGLPIVTRVPVLRELLTSAASCVLSA